MIHARSEYKSTLRKNKFVYDRSETKRLETARLSNAKEYWKMLKCSTNITSKCSISSSDFFKYFKAINDPESVFYQPDEDVVFLKDRYFNSELDVMFFQN